MDRKMNDFAPSAVKVDITESELLTTEYLLTRLSERDRRLVVAAGSNKQQQPQLQPQQSQRQVAGAAAVEPKNLRVQSVASWTESGRTTSLAQSPVEPKDS